MIVYAQRASRQIDALLQYYEEHQRDNASEALSAALAEAERRIAANPAAGLPAPRPYPKLARPSVGWIKARRYWIAYQMAEPPVIIGVYFETADIPNRF